MRIFNFLFTASLALSFVKGHAAAQSQIRRDGLASQGQVSQGEYRGAQP